MTMRLLVQLCVLAVGTVLVLLGGMTVGTVLVLLGGIVIGVSLVLDGPTIDHIVGLPEATMRRIGNLFDRLTMGRMIVALYTAVVVALAWSLLPWYGEGSSVQAVRYLGANTRLSPDLWREPRDRLEVRRVEIARLGEALAGTYLRKPVEADAPLSRADVMPWPELGNQEIVTVQLDEAPDLRLFNQGATVDVWYGQNLATVQHTEVQAIVPASPQRSAAPPADTKWIVLVPRKDFSAASLANLGSVESKDKLTVRLVTPPHKPLPPH
jgi:hypothetical protein